ncbi:hypothetical protein SARC_14113 [Sphaeroforma arctica JP610]|uniref:OB domain-containing protein n=1 Tax=Sphaeroforma arctica JP610 TaxID=667725 RepID=A0A0L0F9C6_9EUKA|nr:hypothetical protein SARC_14113 [Sphaeroforma arctica JP610]KNC73327.1 hypothetical protein SARC_14113 [Sphaeroforma arctica JP610]|eukprot:XP_014147229.1 hypothetical protein SARC_14113 [Sphaeroforma arctica JP610]
MQSIRRSTRLRGALEYRQLFGNFQALTNTRMSIHTILCTRCTQNRLDISVMTSFSTYKKLLSPKHRLAHSLLKSSHCGESSISRAHILSPASICSYRYLTTKDKSDKQTIGEDKLKIDWSRASAIHSTALPGGAREVSESWVSRGKYSIPYKTISVVQKEGTIGDEVCVRGYVKSDRRQKDVTFLDVTDGTVMHALQVVGTPESIPR